MDKTDHITSNLTIFDIANWFLEKEPMTHKKLQKLCYYAVAWGWALMGRPIAEDARFEAWVHGPVSPVLFRKYRDSGWNSIAPKDSAPHFDPGLSELLESVWVTYGDKDGTELEALSHSERPWQEARIGLERDERGNKEISPDIMKSFYKGIYEGDE